MYAYTFIMRMNANYTNLCGERGESRLSEPAAFRPARGYISILLSLSISTFFIVATATKSFCYCSLLRRFRLTLDHRDFVLILFSRDNLRLAAQPVPFYQILFKFFPLRVRRSTQTLARIAHDHRARPALAVATAIHEFRKPLVDFHARIERDRSENAFGLIRFDGVSVWVDECDFYRFSRRRRRTSSSSVR